MNNLIEDFPDDQLEAAIRAVVEQEAGEIDDEVLRKITTLDLSNKGIEDLTGIGRLTNLEELNIQGNDINDLTPLAQLENLESVYIDTYDILYTIIYIYIYIHT